MTRKETIDRLGAGEKIYTRSLIGKAYDCGMEEGTAQGYSSGVQDANRYASMYMVSAPALPYATCTASVKNVCRGLPQHSEKGS